MEIELVGVNNGKYNVFVIKDDEYKKLQERLLLDDKKQPIDLTKKMLYRIFSNNDFGQGGRFYRGWWQNVPSEYRQFITIDSKRTQEYDFSQLGPNMIYSLYNLYRVVALIIGCNGLTKVSRPLANLLKLLDLTRTISPSRNTG